MSELVIGRFKDRIKNVAPEHLVTTVQLSLPPKVMICNLSENDVEDIYRQCLRLRMENKYKSNKLCEIYVHGVTTIREVDTTNE